MTCEAISQQGWILTFVFYVLSFFAARLVGEMIIPFSVVKALAALLISLIILGSPILWFLTNFVLTAYQGMNPKDPYPCSYNPLHVPTAAVLMIGIFYLVVVCFFAWQAARNNRKNTA